LGLKGLLCAIQLSHTQLDSWTNHKAGTGAFFFVAATSSRNFTVQTQN
jgi:hypothetical protein